MANAIMAKKDFESERRKMILLQSDGTRPDRQEKATTSTAEPVLKPLRIPRRPRWQAFKSKEELHEAEMQNYLQWRRDLAKIEQDETKLSVTPFEKNLAMWKQLWRVIDRSDVVVQIVDARAPLMFWCPDLVEYVGEVNPNKKNLLLLNKADLLTEERRIAWGRYLNSHGVDFLFFSAKAAQDELDAEHKAQHGGLVSAFEEALIATEKLAREEDPREAALASDVAAMAEVLGDPIIDDDDGDEGSTGGGSVSSLGPVAADDVGAAGAEPDEAVDRDGSAEEAAEAPGMPSEADLPIEPEPPRHTIKTGPIESEEDLIDRCRVLTRSEIMDFIVAEYHDLVNVDTGVRAALPPKPKPAERAAPVPEVMNPLRPAAGDAAEAAAGEAAESAGVGVPEDEPEAEEEVRPVVVGMVGYPNVGKSSTINALLGVTAASHGISRVAVAATPGKTKHFQTLSLTDRITLCDCPGLVFPSFVSTREEMVVNGVLPIDQLREHRSPISLICRRIPREVLESTYTMKLPKPRMDEPRDRPPTAIELLDTFCRHRGIMANTHAGGDHSRAARMLLKDYVRGKLLYCHPPPVGRTPESVANAPSSKASGGAGGTVTRARRVPKKDLGGGAMNVLADPQTRKQKTIVAAAADTMYEAPPVASEPEAVAVPVEGAIEHKAGEEVDAAGATAAEEAGVEDAGATLEPDVAIDDIELDDADLAMLGVLPDQARARDGGTARGKAWRARNREKRNRRPRRKGDRPSDPYGVMHDPLVAGLVAESGPASLAAKQRRGAAIAPETFTRHTARGAAPEAAE